jgi:riboflavin synthase
MIKVGIADTTFARINMFKFVADEIDVSGHRVKIERYTVPGIKDLPVAAKRLIDGGCELVVALGMPGGAEIDKQCANQASLGIMQAQVMTGKHIIEVFVHEDEAEDDRALLDMARDRSRKHARNAMRLLFEPEWLEKRAGSGLRQGSSDAGPIRP